MKGKLKSIMCAFTVAFLWCTAMMCTNAASEKPSAILTYGNGYASSDTAGVLIAADYENEALRKVLIHDITPGEKIAIELQQGDVLMLWDSIEMMHPLAGKYTIGMEPLPSTPPIVTPGPVPTPDPGTLTYLEEDFEGWEPGNIANDSMWKHNGGGILSDIINCTTDSTNSTKAVRWYASGTSGARSKQFTLLNSVPDVTDGEIFTFSADVRLGVTNGNTTILSFGNNIDTSLLNISIKNSMDVAVNDKLVKLPSVIGTEEEGVSGRSISKWFNICMSIDSALKENNTTISFKPLNAEDKFVVDENEVSEYTINATSSVNAITQMNASVCKGYFGSIIMDNLKLSKTVNPKSELTKVLALYDAIDTSLYQEDNIQLYENALNSAKLLYNAQAPSKEEITSAKTALIEAASMLRLKEYTDGGRTMANQNPDWLFIKEPSALSGIHEIVSAKPTELDIAGWEAVDLPHTWNAYDGSDGVSGYDRTKSWYRKNIYIDPQHEGKKIYLEFEGSAMKTGLYINGQPVPLCTDDPYGLGEETTYIHRGGYETFRFDITGYVKYGEQNLAAVSVDNINTIETVPLGGDFSKEGGIYRDVTLVVTNPVHLDMMDHGSTGLYLTPQKVTDVTDDTNKDFDLTAQTNIINESKKAQAVKIEAVLREPDHFDIPEDEYIKKYLRFNPEEMYTPGGKDVKSFTTQNVVIDPGESYDYRDTVLVESPKLWDGIENPYQYEVALKVYVDDILTEDIVDNVGFRYYYAPTLTSVNSGGKFYLNGRQYDLRGAGKHQDWGFMENALGVAVTDRERLHDAGVMYEMGLNTLRLVHYPHSLHEIELYDKLGIMVWSEVSLVSVMVNADAAGYPSFEATTLQQLESMIKQQYNNPSVFFWGFSNEITHEADDNLKLIPEQEKKFTSAPALFRKMYDKAKQIDPVRLTTYAANTIRHNPDLKTDLLGMNIYPYWYNETTAPNKNLNSYFQLQFDDNGGKKPMAFGEVGGAAVVGRTQEYNDDGTVTFYGTSTAYTTYQAFMHERILSDIEKNTSAVWAMFIWQMFDSANDTKDAVFPGMNIKGLVSYDHTTKKDAYYFYKANWNSFEPFVHVVNAERTQRPSDKTIIRAYSNSEKCQLYLNGKPYAEPITDTNISDGVADGFHIFMWYDVPLVEGGETTIEIRGINGTEEVSTSLDNNGEIIFTAADMSKLVLTSKDVSKLEIVGNTANLIGGESNGATIESVLNYTLVSVPEGSYVKVYDKDTNEVTSGALTMGMTIRVLDAVGNYQNYEVVAQASNIAQYKTAKASSTESGSNPASMAVDGIVLENASNSWKAKNKSSGEWIMVDLGATYNMNEITTYFENKDSRVYPYEVQVSNDGVSFTTIIDRTSNKNSAKTSDKVGKISGRYLKLLFGVCRYDGSDRIATVREIELYGWRFINNGGYTIDEENKMIYLGETDTEHDTYEVFANLRTDGQASYDIKTQEAGRVLSNGDKLTVTEEYGGTVEYTLNMGDPPSI